MYNCSVGSPGDCGFAASMACISPAAQQDHHRGAPSSDLCLSICSCLAYFSGFLLGNCRCFSDLLMGLENLQYHEGVRARWLAEKAGQHYRHPYDVGVFTNLSMVGSISLFFCY